MLKRVYWRKRLNYGDRKQWTEKTGETKALSKGRRAKECE
jgi:hypothetical protein